MESVAASTRCADASLTLSDFQFDLPPELIAQVPAERRDDARLLVLDRSSGELTHTHVHTSVEHLRPGDLLVVNDTKVIPARLFGRTASGGAVELLLIRALTSALFQGGLSILPGSDVSGVGAVREPPEPARRIGTAGRGASRSAPTSGENRQSPGSRERGGGCVSASRRNACVPERRSLSQRGSAPR